MYSDLSALDIENFSRPAVVLYESIITTCNALFAKLVNRPATSIQGTAIEAFLFRHHPIRAHERATSTESRIGNSDEVIFTQPFVIQPFEGAPVFTEVETEEIMISGTHHELMTFISFSDAVRDLQAENWRLRTGVEMWDVSVFEHDHVQQQVYASQEFRDIYGLSPDEEITMQRLGESIHPDDADLEAVLKSHDPAGDGRFDRKYRVIRPDGNIRWVHSRAQSYFGIVDGKKVCVRTIGTVIDITEKHQLEISVDAHREKLSNILDSLPSIVVLVSEEGYILQANKMAKTQSGGCHNEALTQRLDVVFPMLQSRMDDILNAVKRHATLELSRLAYASEDAGTQFFNISVTPLHGAASDGAVVRIDDVSEQMRMEQMLIQSEKLLSVGGLAAGMAHEINNPLSAILQGVQVIQLRLMPEHPKNQEAARRNSTSVETVVDYLGDRNILRTIKGIGDAGTRAAAIARNMLGFVRISDNSISNCSMAELMDKTIDLALNDYDLSKKYDLRKIEIVRDYSPDLPPVTCDSGKVQQVLLNLIRNAGQALCSAHSPQPRIRVRIFRTKSHTRIEFEDNGPGIPENISRRIFEPFFTTKPPGEGTGLGLSISWNIVTRDHNGHMFHEPASDGGARFIVELP